MAESPRIAPLEPPYTPDIAALLARWMPPGAAAEPLALFRTFAVHDDLAGRMRPLGAGILARGRVAPADRELVIHRVCARCRAEYEWGVHAVAFGRAVGLSEAQLAATVHGGVEDPVWDERQRLLVAFVDALHDTASVDDALWAALAAEWRPDELLELTITAGWYRLIAYVVNVARVPLEPWAARFPAPA